MIKSLSRKKVGVVLVSTAAVLVVSLLVYSVAWRPSDSDLQTAISDISTMQASTATGLPAAIKSVSTPIGINLAVTENFKKTVNAYTDALSLFEKSPALQRSVSMPSAYAPYKSALSEYGQALETLSKSVDTYGQILAACDSMVASFSHISSSGDFDRISSQCSKTLADTSSSPDTAFNKQFLDSYRQKAQQLVAAYKQYYLALDTKDTNKISSANTAATTAKHQLLEPLYVTIDYPITPPSADIYTKLITVLDKEKTALIR